MVMRVCLLLFGMGLGFYSGGMALQGLSVWTWIWFFVMGVLLALHSGSKEWPEFLKESEPCSTASRCSSSSSS